MALSDILERIARDGRAEADAIEAAAREEAGRIVADARAQADALLAREDARARAEADREAGTVRANARLAARDRQLQEKRALIERVLAEAKAAVIALPDDQYASLFARRIAEFARGGEQVRIAAADRERLAGRLSSALAEAGVAVTIAEEPADVPHGVVLVGERMNVDLSVDAIVDARTEEMSGRIAEILFGGREASA